jgi:hypothetical protein
MTWKAGAGRHPALLPPMISQQLSGAGSNYISPHLFFEAGQNHSYDRANASIHAVLVARRTPGASRDE